MRGPSPFRHRSAVTDPRHFFGRRRALASVLGRVAESGKPQCVSVVGLRRIGKSSLLRQLADVHVPAASRPDAPIVSVYHDLEGSGGVDVGRFFRTLRRRLEKQLGTSSGSVSTGSGPADAAREEESFFERIETLSDDGVRVALFLDEFDAVTLNPYFDADLFGRLRHLASSFQLAYVTSSFAELTDLCHQGEIRQSPFFNVFSSLPLSLLTPDDAREMLAVESERAGGAFTPEETALALDLGGCHPFHLQQAADALWEHGSEGEAGVAKAFTTDATPHFRHAWVHLAPGAASLLLSCATGRVASDAPGDAADFLQRRGLVTSADGCLKPFSSAFLRWLKQQAAPPLLESTFVREPSGQEREPSEPDTAPPVAGRRVTRSLQVPRLPEAGALLDGRYALLRELGRGGFGIVFEAEDKMLGRHVAVKFLKPERTRGDRGAKARDRFLAEARAASGIHHPHVIAVHDVREHASGWYLVMEYFEGGSLRDHQASRGALPAHQALAFARQAALGLHAAHARGIIHRDVKPENMLVDASGTLKIADFGLAYFLDHARVTSEGLALMTPRYSSPEQVMGEAVDARSDVFGLGCVLHELLTGEFAFDGSSISAVLYRILHHTPPSSPVLERLPPAHVTLISRCLARDPADRPASCAALANELEGLQREA